jgi:predicted DNA-binding transcriptional regulator AlpA
METRLIQRKACSVRTFALEHEISNATVWRLIKDGKLRTVRFGTRVMVWLGDEEPPAYGRGETLLDAG